MGKIYDESIQKDLFFSLKKLFCELIFQITDTFEYNDFDGDNFKIEFEKELSNVNSIFPPQTAKLFPSTAEKIKDGMDFINNELHEYYTKNEKIVLNCLIEFSPQEKFNYIFKALSDYENSYSVDIDDLLRFFKGNSEFSWYISIQNIYPSSTPIFSNARLISPN